MDAAVANWLLFLLVVVVLLLLLLLLLDRVVLAADSAESRRLVVSPTAAARGNTELAMKDCTSDLARILINPEFPIFVSVTVIA
jgi:hypothetical protein